MHEVIAATTTVRKNITATTPLIQGISMLILLKMNGILWKISPGPAPGSMPAANTAGIIASAASRANVRSEIAVPVLEASMFSFLRT